MNWLLSQLNSSVDIMARLSDYMSVKEAAGLLQIHPESVRRLIRKGTLSAIRIANGWFIDRAALQDFASTYDGGRVRGKRLTKNTASGMGTQPSGAVKRTSIYSPSTNELKIRSQNGIEEWEVPPKAPTRYLTHDYFRYIGKIPPQIAQHLIHEYASSGATLVDPMCGGGTTLIEAKLAGLDSVGFDINPVAVLISRVATTHIPTAVLDDAVNRIVSELSPLQVAGSPLFAELPKQKLREDVLVPDLQGNEKFFSDQSMMELAFVLARINSVTDASVREFLTVALLAILRQVSRANVKKMNVEIDEAKKVREVTPTYIKKLRRMAKINALLARSFTDRAVSVELSDARSLPLQDNSADLAIVHPPYMSNTAFSESVQLPLAWLGISHRDIWKKEIEMRGSYMHKTNGLRKYLVGWHAALQELHRVLRPGGVCCAIVGDGKVDYVRIPVGAITEEFAGDLGYRIVNRSQHKLNNNTGRTLSKRMTHQHIVVFERI